MRRTLSGLAVVVLAGLFVGVGAPAQAVEPPPPWVDPAPALPSTLQRSLFTGAPMIDDQIKIAAWLKGMMNARAAGTVAAPAAQAIPLGPASNLARGATGGALTAAFMAGWTITDGTLAMYGAITGDEPMDPSCSVFPSWTHGALKTFYPFSMPDCQAAITAANADIVPGTSVSYAGTSIKINSVLSFPSRTVGWEYCINAAPPSGTQLALRQNNGNWQVVTVSSFFGGTSCRGVAGGAGSPYNFVNQPDAIGAAHPAQSYGSPPFMGIRRTSDGVIVAQQQSANTNPDRESNCTLGWPDGTTTTATGGTYKETQGLPLMQWQNACNDALVSKPGGGSTLLPSEIKIGSRNTDSGAQTEIATSDVPDFTESEKKGLTPGTTTGGLVLSKVVSTGIDSCMTWAADCADWWAESENGTNEDTYRCTYNGEAVSLTECGIYRHTFDTKTSTPTITDPNTGESVDWSSKPNPGNSINPGTGPGSGMSPADTCFETGWASVANPIDWVLVPVKCALVWAFVPRTATVDQGFANLENRWQSTAVGGLAAAVGAWSFVAPSSSGCNGVTVGLSALGHGIEDFQILNACPGSPLQPIAGLSTVVISIGSVLTAIYAVTASIGGIVGARPVAAGPAS